MGIVSSNIASSTTYKDKEKKQQPAQQFVLPETLPSGFEGSGEGGTTPQNAEELIAAAQYQSSRKSATPAATPAAVVTPPPISTTVPTGSKQTSGSSSLLNSGFTDAQLQKIYGKYTNKQDFMKDIFKAAKSRGAVDGKSVLQQVNQMMSTLKFPQTDSTFKEPAPSKEEEYVLPETGIDSLDNIIGFNEENRKEYLSMIEKTKTETNALVDEISKEKDAAVANVGTILTNRSKGVEDTFSAVTAQIQQLEEKANSLFDLNVINAVNARAKQLAAKGILTSEQAAAATGLMLSDYTANANLKRSEIMVQINEQMINALKEKQTALDAIMSDEMKTEQWKVEMSEKVNGLYSNILESYANQWLTANQAIDNNITNAYAQKAQVDVAEKVKEVELEMADEYARKGIDTDADKRIDYILSKVQATDPNMARYAAALLEGYINAGTFMTLPIEQLVAKVLTESAQGLLKDVGSKTSTGGGSAGGGSSYTGTGTPAPVATTPTGGETPTQNMTPEQVLEMQKTNEQAVNSIINTGATPEEKTSLLERINGWVGSIGGIAPLLQGPVFGSIDAAGNVMQNAFNK